MRQAALSAALLLSAAAVSAAPTAFLNVNVIPMTEEKVIEVVSRGEVGARYHEPVVVYRRRDQEIVAGTPVPLCGCGRWQYKQRQLDGAAKQSSIGHPGIYLIQARSYSEARHQLPLQ